MGIFLRMLMMRLGRGVGEGEFYMSFCVVNLNIFYILLNIF